MFVDGALGYSIPLKGKPRLWAGTRRTLRTAESWRSRTRSCVCILLHYVDPTWISRLSSGQVAVSAFPGWEGVLPGSSLSGKVAATQDRLRIQKTQI